MNSYRLGLMHGAAFGAAVVATAAAAAWPEPVVEYHVEVVERHVSPAWNEVESVRTPVIDSMMDDGQLEESQRQSDCLFDYLRMHVGYEITVERVLAAGLWTDSLGGACLVMGVDDE